MIYNAQVMFKSKNEIKQAQKAFDTDVYLELLRHHDLIEVALNSENSKDKEPIAIYINQKGKLPITVWRVNENKGPFNITDYNYRNAARILVTNKDKNYSRIVGLVEHHIKNYKREQQNKHAQKPDNVMFTSALRAQALIKL